MSNKEEAQTLTRSDLADAIIDEFHITKVGALEFLEVILSEMAMGLKEDESVKISGFGTFSIRHKKERIGRNPKTLEEAVISSRKSISFKASPILKKIVNNEEN